MGGGRRDGTADGRGRLQAEAWEAGGACHALVVAQRDGDWARAWLVRADLGTRLVEVGSAAVAACPSHHDARRLAALIPLSPANNDDGGCLGVAGQPPGLVDDALKTLRKPWIGGIGGRHLLQGGMGVGKSTFMARLIHEYTRFGTVRAGTHLPAPGALGYPESARGALRADGGEQPLATAPGEGPCPASVLAVPDADDAGLREAVGYRIRDVLAFVQGERDDAVAWLLGSENWTARAQAFYAAPCEAGARRRQAAGLYPSLAPLIARDDLAALVDAGRPYERDLCDALRVMVSPSRRDGLTEAALRRLRALHPSVGFSGLATCLEAAARLPVDWLPRDAAGWEAFREALSPVIDDVDRLGLALRDVVGGTRGEWARMGTCQNGLAAVEGLALQPAEVQRHVTASGQRHAAASTLRGATDAARRLSDTLLGPVRQAGGLGKGGEGDGPLLAGRLLYGGKSLAGIDALQLRWHAGLDRLEAALPSAGAANAWPRAFPDFVSPDGLLVTCLANEAELKDEGGKGPDASGMEGLDHCVGGYGRRCFSRECQVASVRRREGDRWVRLSTVEFEHFEDDDVPHLQAVQHMGAGNEEPPPEAVAAVEALVHAVAAGRHPVDVDAFALSDGEGYLEAYDWRDPAALARAFEAWAPYLPRDMARGGVQALAGWIAREATLVPPGPRPAPSRGFTLEDPVEFRVA